VKVVIFFGKAGYINNKRKVGMVFWSHLPSDRPNGWRRYEDDARAKDGHNEYAILEIDAFRCN